MSRVPTQAQRERLYALLPTIYRMRDAAQGEPLRALMGVLQEELDWILDDIDRLYRNCFVETCDEWAVPYIGDLVGARLLHGISPRAFVANTLAYRRRKGTPQMLTALARDATGWPAKTVEYFPLVAVAQHVNGTRPRNVIVPDLRRDDELQQLDTPFDRTVRLVDVRTRGRHRPDQVAVHVWRLPALRLQRVRAAEVQPGCFVISPLGGPLGLWSPAQSRSGLDASADIHTVPQALRRRVLHRALEARRQELVDGRTPQEPLFEGEGVFQLFVDGPDGSPQRVPLEEIIVADLSTWWAPRSERSYLRDGDNQPVARPITAALDPELGRLTFAAGKKPRKVWVSHDYGAGAELGGGGYERTLWPAPDTARCVVVRDGDPDRILARLADPAAADSLWQGTGGQLVVEIADSDRYTTFPLRVPSGGRLVLRSASGQRPLLTSEPGPDADDTWAITLEPGAALVLDGVLVAAGLELGAAGEGAARTVILRHATLVPGLRLTPAGAPLRPERPSVLAGPMAELSLDLSFSICGSLALSAATQSTVTAADSILDCAGGALPALAARSASLTRVTVLGAIAASSLDGTVDTLITGQVVAPDGKSSGIRYSYVPDGSDVPALYRCQPDMAKAEALADVERVLAELRPWFVSRRYGTPGYALLDPRCPALLRSGASVEGEPGAFHHLYQAQREANLIDSQAEYLRTGLTLNLFLVT